MLLALLMALSSVVALMSATPGVGATVSAAAPQAAGLGADERRDLVRLVSEAGEELLVTGLSLGAGDRFVAPDNRVYEVTGVSAGVARARQVGRVDLDARASVGLLPLPAATDRVWPGSPGPRSGAGAVSLPFGPAPPADGVVPLVARPDDVRVAIYHTHSDESYLPDSGSTNEPWDGDIFRVGTAMVQVLKRHGLDVLHSHRRHDPHDGMAYARSRRTAMALLRQRPDALFDVHRDTPPASVYFRRIAGQPATSVLLVLGRQNPNISANEAFAFTIKGYADRAYPGLIRGILYAAGDYNQDLFPRAMLAEIGSTYNQLEHAETGARLFSNVVAAMLGDLVPGPGLPRPDTLAEQRRASRRGWQAAGLLIALTAAGFSLYLILNEESYGRLTRLKSRLEQWLAESRARVRRRVGPRV